MSKRFVLSIPAIVSLASGCAMSADPVADSPVTSSSFATELLAILLPLAFIIVGLLFVLRMVRKRYGLTGSDTPLTILQILPLGPRERLVLVKARSGRVFTIGVAAQNVNFLTELSPQDLESPGSIEKPAA